MRTEYDTETSLCCAHNDERLKYRQKHHQVDEKQTSAMIKRVFETLTTTHGECWEVQLKQSCRECQLKISSPRSGRFRDRNLVQNNTQQSVSQSARGSERTSRTKWDILSSSRPSRRLCSYNAVFDSSHIHPCGASKIQFRQTDRIFSMRNIINTTNFMMFFTASESALLNLFL